VHLKATAAVLDRYQRFAKTVDPSRLAAREPTELEVPADLREVGVIGIRAGLGGIVFFLPTRPLDSDEAVLYAPTADDPGKAASRILLEHKISGVAELSERWYYIQYD
jgi:hypothetical protein